MNRLEAITSLRQILGATGACGLGPDDVIDNEVGAPRKEGVFCTAALPNGVEVLYGRAVEEADVFETVPVLRFSELDMITYSQADQEEEDSIDVYFERSNGQYRIHYNQSRLDCGEMSSSCTGAPCMRRQREGDCPL